MLTDCNSAGHFYSYAEWFRNDVINAVPSTARCVLSVGCGSGLTEAELVKRGIKVVGVELNPKAVEIGKQRGLIMLEGDASEIDIDVISKPYDCLVYADILEHLPEPVAVLKRHVKSLKPNGIVYVSIPNFRHYSVFWQLFVCGRVNYVDAGILDRTHLRITTRKIVREWFENAGIKLVSWKYINNGRKAKLLAACSLFFANEFTAAKINLVGKKI